MNKVTVSVLTVDLPDLAQLNPCFYSVLSTTHNQEHFLSFSVSPYDIKA